MKEVDLKLIEEILTLRNNIILRKGSLMNYKQMVLLEDLVSQLWNDSVEVVFTMDYDYCMGTFRKLEVNESEPGEFAECWIDSEKLLEDYQQFALGSHEYFEDLVHKLNESDVEAKRDKIQSSILVDCELFLIEQGSNIDDYLTGYDGPEIVYNLYKLGEHHERYLIKEPHIEPVFVFEKEKLKS